MAGLPGGPQIDKEKSKKKKTSKQKQTIQKKVKGYVIMYYTINTVVLSKSQHCVYTYCPFKSSWVS